MAKGADKEGSDIDLLVDLRKGTSLFGLVGLQLDIEDALGVKVDLCTEGGLHPELKERILSEARPVSFAPRRRSRCVPRIFLPKPSRS